MFVLAFAAILAMGAIAQGSKKHEEEADLYVLNEDLKKGISGVLDLLSQNEDTDLVDIIIRYSSAETIYNSSLSAASKLVQTSLLDFL